MGFGYEYNYLAMNGVVYRTVLCYHPYLVSTLLLSLHFLTFLMFFILVIESVDSICRDSADTQ